MLPPACSSPVVVFVLLRLSWSTLRSSSSSIAPIIFLWATTDNSSTRSTQSTQSSSSNILPWEHATLLGFFIFFFFFKSIYRIFFLVRTCLLVSRCWLMFGVSALPVCRHQLWRKFQCSPRLERGKLLALKNHVLDLTSTQSNALCCPSSCASASITGFLLATDTQRYLYKEEKEDNAHVASSSMLWWVALEDVECLQLLIQRLTRHYRLCCSCCCTSLSSACEKEKIEKKESAYCTLNKRY